MNSRCKACDCILSTLDIKLDDELCLECLQISIDTTFDGFGDSENDK